MDRVMRPGNTGGLLVEDQRELRPLHLRLLDMVGIVEPDSEEFRRMQHGRLELDLRHADTMRAGARGLARAIERGRSRGQKRGHLTRQLGRRCSQIDYRVTRDDTNPGRPAMRESS